MILRSEVRQEILEKPCDRCGELVERGGYLSFRRGEYVMFHDDCFQAEMLPVCGAAKVEEDDGAKP